MNEAADKLGGLDILVNNAGRQQFNESILTLSTEDFDATFKTNVYAPFWLTKAALAHLPRGAAIINTSSVQAFKPSDILLDYAQTKACNVAFTKALAKQLGPEGIRVNAVAPGPYWTPLQPSGGQPQEKWNSLVLMRRWAVPVNRLKSHRSMSLWLPMSAVLPRAGVVFRRRYRHSVTHRSPSI